MVPIRAMPEPVKLIVAGRLVVVMLTAWLTACCHAPELGVVVGSSTAAANSNAKPPLAWNWVTIPAGGGPLKKRPGHPVEPWIADTAAKE